MSSYNGYMIARLNRTNTKGNYTMITEYNPLKDGAGWVNGVQTVCICAEGWSAPYFKVFASGQMADKYITDECYEWGKYTDKVEVIWYGYDCLVNGDDGEFIGTDGYPDAVGTWHDTLEEVTWERA